MEHTLSDEGEYPAAAQDEAYKVFQMADPGGQPAEQYYSVVYYVLLALFDDLQAAGPDLTPASFQHGAFSMPESGPGQLGSWGGGPNSFSPLQTTQIGWWDPSATSNFDGKKGAWESCQGGQWFNFLNPSPSAFAPDHTQLQCG